MKYFVVFVSVLLVRSCAASPQDSLWIGIWGAANINQNRSDFTQLPNVANCCADFQSGSGVGPSFGVLAEKLLHDNLWLAVRAGYFGLSGSLSATAHSTENINDAPTEADVRHTIDADIGTVAFEPVLQWHLPSGFYFGVGVNAGIVMQSTFHQYETLVLPSNGTFENGSNVRNDTSGNIPNVAQLNASIVAMAGAEFPLNHEHSLILAPSVSYALGVTPIVKNISWHVNTLQLGVALMYSPMREAVPAPPPPTLPRPFVPKRRATVVQAQAQESTTASLQVDSVSPLRITATTTTESFPLLPEIYFDSRVWDLPRRYVHRSADDARTFNENNLPNNAIAIEHNILDICGKRLKDHPAITITVTGIADNKLDDEGDTALATSRAETIKKYFTDVWNIDAKRIRIDEEIFSGAVSAPDSSMPETDHRRVEISSTNEMLLQPVVHSRFDAYAASPAGIGFTMRSQPESRIQHWKLEAGAGGMRDSIASGAGIPPLRFMWNPTDASARFMHASDSVEIIFSVIDDSDYIIESTTPLRVDHATDSVEIDRLRLVIPDFDNSELTPAEHKTIQRFIDDGEFEASRARIYGTTTLPSDSARNQKFSQALFGKVKKILLQRHSAMEIEENGNPELLQPVRSAFPEVRRYARQMIIEVKTKTGK